LLTALLIEIGALQAYVSKHTSTCDRCSAPTLPADVQEHVQNALYADDISQDARSVLTVIIDGLHFGGPNAIQLADLQAKLLPRLSDRAIEACVKELVEFAGVPVGSTRSGTPGYYIIVTDDDAEMAAAPLLWEIASLARRVRVLSPKADIIRRIKGQQTIGQSLFGDLHRGSEHSD
jgi:hypothetical protein